MSGSFEMSRDHPVGLGNDPKYVELMRVRRRSTFCSEHLDYQDCHLYISIIGKAALDPVLCAAAVIPFRELQNLSSLQQFATHFVKSTDYQKSWTRTHCWTWKLFAQAVGLLAVFPRKGGSRLNTRWKLKVVEQWNQMQSLSKSRRGQAVTFAGDAKSNVTDWNPAPIAYVPAQNASFLRFPAHQEVVRAVAAG